MPAKGRFERIDHSLELEESLHVHAAERIAQRIAGLAVLVIIVIALAGLFGDGKLAGTQVEGESASLRYDRIVRSSKETLLEFDVTGNAQVLLPFAYLRDFKLDRIVPEPADTRLADGGARYHFESASAATLRFYVVPRRAGVTRAVLEVNGDAFAVHQRVLP